MTISQKIKKPKSAHKPHKHDLVRSIRLMNFESGETAIIMPNLGAAVLELVLKSGKNLLSILESPGSLHDIIENKHYHGAKLMPYPGRIPTGLYEFNGKKYRLKANAEGGAFSIHGFVLKKPFRIVRMAVNNRQASVILEYKHKGDTKGYPFKFSLRLTYTLGSKSFNCKTVVRNLDKCSIPMGDGWHPYYRTSKSIRHLSLLLPPHTVIELGREKIPNGRVRGPFRKASAIALSRKTMDSVFDFGEKRRRVTTKLIDRKLGVELRIWQEAGLGKYRYLVVYRPPTGTSIAIEPWTCAPNAFNNKIGLITLKPGRKFEASYGVSLKATR